MIEVRASAKRQPLGMTPARFLREYWQRKPLLVRGAFHRFADPLTPNDLAGLACEPASLSRLVVHDASRDRWDLRSGPFESADFARLPARDWTVLVQDVDKWDGDVAALLDRFAFLPSWRIDDVMVSYAVDGGSVGAHIDHYDVFLLQGLGRRRWRISTDPGASMATREDAEIKLLRDFGPTHEWTLDAGDMLYLPPGVPHHGVAIGECMTYSIGMRAPSYAELLGDFADTLAAEIPEELRFGDAGLSPARGDGEIDEAAFARVAEAMPWLKVSRQRDVQRSGKNHEKNVGKIDGCSGEVDASMLRTWFCSFVTRYRSALAAEPRSRAMSDGEFARALASGARAVRLPWSRAAWYRDGRNAQLFVAGCAFACSIALARQVAGRAPFALATNLAARDRDVLRRLVDLGHVSLSTPRRRSRR